MPPDSTNNAAEAEPVLEIRNLFTHFESDEGVVKAVDGVTFSLDRGKTLGVVGESGCGKSVMVQSILQIVGPTGAIKDGEILRHRDREVVNPADPGRRQPGSARCARRRDRHHLPGTDDCLLAGSHHRVAVQGSHPSS